MNCRFCGARKPMKLGPKNLRGEYCGSDAVVCQLPWDPMPPSAFLAGGNSPEMQGGCPPGVAAFPPAAPQTHKTNRAKSNDRVRFGGEMCDPVGACDRVLCAHRPVNDDNALFSVATRNRKRVWMYGKRRLEQHKHIQRTLFGICIYTPCSRNQIHPFHPCLTWAERQSSSPNLASSTERLEVPHCPAPPSSASNLRVYQDQGT